MKTEAEGVAKVSLFGLFVRKDERHLSIHSLSKQKITKHSPFRTVLRMCLTPGKVERSKLVCPVSLLKSGGRHVPKPHFQSDQRSQTCTAHKVLRMCLTLGNSQGYCRLVNDLDLISP